MLERIAPLMISVIILFGLGQGLSSREVPDKSTCQFKGHHLYGKIKFVESFPDDITVEVVNTFPDVKVKLLGAFLRRWRQRQIVTSFSDTNAKTVESFGDIKVKFVDSFPGLAR